MGLEDLSDSELERYARHLVLPEIEEAGQDKIRAARVALVGLGGIGAQVLPTLVGAGLGGLVLYDPDQVELSNLHRQAIYAGQVGAPKVEAARRFAQALNPRVEIETHAQRFERIPPQVDLIIDGTDTFEARLEVADLALASQVPLISAAVIGFEGQVFVQGPEGQPSYATWMAGLDAPRVTCADTGVFGPWVQLVGAFAASLALRALVNGTEQDEGQVWLLDGRSLRMQRLRVPA